MLQLKVDPRRLPPGTVVGVNGVAYVVATPLILVDIVSGHILLDDRLINPAAPPPMVDWPYRREEFYG